MIHFDLIHKTGVVRKNRWRFRIVGGNNEIIAVSEHYNNRADAMAAITLIQTEAATAEVVPAISPKRSE